MIHIPRILHMIWIGPEPFPFEKNLETYKKCNPDWKIMFWTDKNIPKLQNAAIYKEIPSIVYATKADLLRIELLYKYGGIYVDADSTCLRPLTDFLPLAGDCFFSTNFRGE